MAQSVHSAGYELDAREIVFRFPASIRSFIVRIAHSGCGIQPNLLETEYLRACLKR